MKTFYLIFTSLLIICCREKNFADDITLEFPKNTKMKIQEFNEDLDEMGSEIIYLGNRKNNIDVKYYIGIIPPPPKIKKKGESENDYKKRMQNENDSIHNIQKPYFRNQQIKLFYSKNIPVDSINNKTIEVIANINDTIPLYKNNGFENKLKKYKAFPVFIKNISNKTLKIPTESKGVAFYAFDNDRKNFYYLRNSNYMICGYGLENRPYFELKPNEILVYAYPFFKKGKIHKAKVKFYDASSKEFNISIDDKIIEDQRNRYIMDF